MVDTVDIYDLNTRTTPGMAPGAPGVPGGHDLRGTNRISYNSAIFEATEKLKTSMESTFQVLFNYANCLPLSTIGGATIVYMQNYQNLNISGTSGATGSF